MTFTTLRCKFCRRKAVEWANHIPVCCDHQGMQFWRQHGKTFTALCDLETDHLVAIIQSLVRKAKIDWVKVCFEEYCASVEYNGPFSIRHEWMEFSHYLLEPLLEEAEKRGYRADSFG